MRDEEAAIDALSEAAGIAASYRDTEGGIRRASEDTKRAMLSAMGVDVGSAGAVRAACEAHRDAVRRRLLPPVVVLRRESGAALSIALTLPEASRARPLDWWLETEDGRTLSGRLAPASLEVHRRLPLAAKLDHGYHRLRVASAGVEAAATLICAPRTAFVPDWLERGERQWGIACPLFSLWSEEGAGIGDFSDLAALARLARELGASTIGLNPLHAPLPGEAADPNPYLPSSRVFVNPAHIAVAGLVAAARGDSLVDYPLVRRRKQDALLAAYRARAGGAATELPGFRTELGPRLERFAVFNALAEQFAPLPWHAWPAGFRRPDTAEVARFARTHADRVGYHAWVQCVADRQLADTATEVGLYRDLAVGVGPNGADAWADQDTYVAGVSIGAPPDAFNPAGQTWGTPPPSPPALRASAYAPFIAALRANMRHARAVRIDHVMGLERLFWVPSGSPAGAGAYVHYPVEDLLAIVALESHRSKCLVVGEDLGTLPIGFHERMEDVRILSYRLLMFERYPDGLFHRPSTYPRLALASSATHDLPSIRAWWDGQDIALRQRLGLREPADAVQERQGRWRDRELLIAALRDQGLIGDDFAGEDFAALAVAIERFLARTPSALIMANLSDMLAEAVQINVPGTVAECPNWRHRFRLPVEAIGADPLVRRIAAAIATERHTAMP